MHPNAMTRLFLTILTTPVVSDRLSGLAFKNYNDTITQAAMRMTYDGYGLEDPLAYNIKRRQRPIVRVDIRIKKSCG